MSLSHEVRRSGVARLGQQYAEHALSPEEVTAQVLVDAEAVSQRHNAIAVLNHDDAASAAAASAERYRRGEPLGSMDGVPVSVKDSFHVAGLPRWHGSAATVASPSTWESAVVRKLRAAGAVIFGKTAMPDFGIAGSGLSSQFGTVTSPWDPSLSPGGSSSGAAVCLAAGVGPVAVGTDMGGSVRNPAAQSGLVALKPSRGRVPYETPKPHSSAGPMARTVHDLSILLETIGSYDAADGQAMPGHFRPLEAPFEDLSGVKVGLLLDMPYGLSSDAQTRTAVQTVASQIIASGAEVIPFAFDGLEQDSLNILEDVFAVDALTEYHSLSAARRGMFHPDLAVWMERGYRFSALDYATKMGQIGVEKAKISAKISEFDYVISPVIPTPQFDADWWGPERSRGILWHCAFSVWYNQTGHPAGSIAAGLTAAGLPIGVQVIGQRFHDAGVIEILRFIERNRAFDLSFPFLE